MFEVICQLFHKHSLKVTARCGCVFSHGYQARYFVRQGNPVELFYPEKMWSASKSSRMLSGTKMTLRMTLKSLLHKRSPWFPHKEPKSLMKKSDKFLHKLHTVFQHKVYMPVIWLPSVSYPRLWSFCLEVWNSEIHWELKDSAENWCLPCWMNSFWTDKLT